MILSLIIVIAVAGVLLFVIDALVGIHVRRSQNSSGDSEYFREAVKLWSDAIAKIDELTRRNVVELGSVRERLADVTQSMSRSEVVESIDELAERLHLLTEEVHHLTVQTEKGLAQSLEPKAMDSPSLPSSEGSHPEEAPLSEDSASDFEDFLSELTREVDLGTSFISLLDFVYDEFQKFVPYERMGYAEIDYPSDKVSAVWHRSKKPARLKGGYSATLSKSSLQFVAEQNRPRILNLHEYLLRHPNSHSTRLLVEEGLGSSLTFPVAVNETVVAFFFITSVATDGFDDNAVEQVRKIVQQISRRKAFLSLPADLATLV